LKVWSAAAERSGDAALNRFGFASLLPRAESADIGESRSQKPKRRRRCALPAHSKSAAQ